MVNVFSRTMALALALLAVAAGAGQINFQEEQVILLEEGKTYRLINGEPITGRDVIDVLIEEGWDSHVQRFVEYALRKEEIEAAKITVSKQEVEIGLQALVNDYAMRSRLKPEDVKLEKLAQEGGLAGGLNALRRDIELMLGLLKVFHQEGQLKDLQTINDPRFKEALTQRLEKRVQEKGVERDKSKLGTGEAVRIGVRGYGMQEVREFLKDVVGQLPRSELIGRLELICMERMVQAELKKRTITLGDTDLSFHFHYIVNKIEADTGLPGRETLMQQLPPGVGIKEFMEARVFRVDAAITRMAKDGIQKAQLEAEFKNHPERYKREELKIAHIIIRVLDPDGRPYNPHWRAPGHDVLNAHVARVREEQYAKFKPKIESLLPLAKADFNGTAQKYSEDSAAARQASGLIGRIGPNAVLPQPCDNAVRDAALKLKPGEISAPIRSDYGWHILKCMEDQEVTYGEAELKIFCNLIHERKRAIDERLRSTAKIEDKF